VIQYDVLAGALPQTPLLWGSFQCSPSSLAGFKGLLLRGGRGLKGKGKEWEGQEGKR